MCYQEGTMTGNPRNIDWVRQWEQVHIIFSQVGAGRIFHW